MNIEEFQSYCIAKPGTTEELPFGPEILTYKVGGKIYALTSLNEDEFRVNLKCDPEKAMLLRTRYPDTVLPGYHMNKRHWNTVVFSSSELSGAALRDLINHSYELVVRNLSKAVRESLLNERP